MLTTVTRRKFLAIVSEGLTFLLSGCWLSFRFNLLEAGEIPIHKNADFSRVVSIHNSNACFTASGFDNDDLNGDVVRQMINSCILAFTGEKELNKAWRKIIPDASKKVAIKINCQIKGVYTKAKVVQPLLEGLIAYGVAADNIIIYDMTDTAFDLAGFKRNVGPGVKVGRVADFGGYSRFMFHRLANLLTGGYENSAWNLLAKVGRESRFGITRFVANLLLHGKKPQWDCEYLINVPVLKALDDFSGVTLSMKNHYGSFGNPSEHHDDIMDYIPLINNLPEVRNKTRLIVLDAIFGEYKWINGRDQKYVERVNKVLVSDDPVAIDTLGWRMIEDLRKKHGLTSVLPSPVFIAKAAQLGIGHNDPAHIEQVVLDLAD